MPASLINGAAEPKADTTYLSRPAPGIIGALFCGYLAVGLPLPVIPLFIHDMLDFNSLVVGVVIGIQFLATVLSRGYAGHLTDLHGGKHSALRGAAISATAGALYLAAAMPVLSPNISLALIFVGRLIAGLGESLFVTGCVSWSIASVGPQRAGMSMSWTGIAMFAALAIGAPIGMGLYRAWGLETAMMACVLAPAVGGVIALREHPYATPPGPRLPFHKVISQIWREGAGLMLQGVGLSGLTAFASLYFAARHWDNAGFVMTAFGVGFIFVRVVFGSLPDKVSGYRVALWSLVIEATGQLIIWTASSETAALAGALITGLGCALIFPALGVEALKRVPPANRGSAMGAFVAFLDIAYGVSGPVSGAIAAEFGYASVYLFGATCAVIGAVLVRTARFSKA